MSGLELMAVGMTTVMLFLLLMVCAIQILRLLEPKQSPSTKTSSVAKTTPVAILAAAVSAYQADAKSG